MRWRALQIRTRLTLWYVAVFTLVFVATATLLVLNLRATLRTNAEESLELTYRSVAARLSEGVPLSTVLHETVIPGEVGQPEVVGQWLGATGAVVDSSGQSAVTTPAVGAEVLAEADQLGHWHGPLRLPGRDSDDVVIAVRHDGPRDARYLVLAQTLRPASSAVSHLLWLLAGVTPVALALAAFGGWIVAGAALRPVDDLSRRAAAIDAAHPHEPLPVGAANDEVSRLAVTLNGMLDRLEHAFAAERRFTADASHELRTPLAVIEAELDVALRSDRTPPEAKQVLRSVQLETSSLSRVVNDLLLLARSEAAGHVELDRRPEDLLDLAVRVTARLRPVADAHGLELSVTGEPTTAEVDADLLARAIANLVDNAMRHTDPGGSVRVLVGRDGGAHGAPDATRIEVTDTGHGIAADELDHIFDRFYRVDPVRNRRDGGSGLGLELSQRIVDAHGGHIEVTSAVGVGSTFTVVLPTKRGVGHDTTCASGVASDEGRYAVEPL